MGVLFKAMAREAGRLRRGLVLEGRARAGRRLVRHRDRAPDRAVWGPEDIYMEPDHGDKGRRLARGRHGRAAQPH